MIVLVGIGAATEAHAQEVQVPLDEDGRVQVVDARLAERLDLFVDEYPGFESASLYRLADGSYALEIIFRREGQRVRDRRTLSPDEAAALRADVTGRLAARPQVDFDQDGRFLLLGQTTLLGVTFYGWAVPTALGVREPAGFAGTYLLTAAGSFFLPFLLTQDEPVSYGMANLSRSGAMRGIGHGTLLYHVLAGPEGERNRVRGIAAAAVLTSVAEGAGGYMWARAEDMDAGTAATIANGADLGLLWGMGVPGIAGQDDFTRRGPASLALAGAAAGIWGGHQLASRRDYTWGDANVMRTGGMVGVLAGLALVDLAGATDSPPFWGGAMAGSAAGALLSDRMVRDLDFTVGQSVLVQLGTLAGGLSGMGVAALAEAGFTGLLTSTAIGAAAGFGLTYMALEGDARRGGDAVGIDLRISPVMPDPTSGTLRPGATVEGSIRF